MTQEEIEKSIKKLNQSIKIHQAKIDDKKEQIQELKNIARKLDDPHALIPKNNNTLVEWKDGHPQSMFVDNHICGNKTIAEEIQRSCNTYQQDYYIKRYR